jgi:hypothetical protein
MNEASNPVDGRIFSMTENEREEFVQSMVKLCENDVKLRSSLLGTVWIFCVIIFFFPLIHWSTAKKTPHDYEIVLQKQ